LGGEIELATLANSFYTPLVEFLHSNVKR